MADQPLPVIAWRLRVLMADRDIRTTRALRKRLADFGVVLSEPQLGRIVKALPRSLNLQVLAALCAVLKTTPGELLIIPGQHRSTPPHEDLPSPEGSASVPARPPPVTSDLSTVPAERPRATALPRPKY